MTLTRLDLTLSTPAENLACDEALLDQAEGEGGPAVLRFWESPRAFVVLGYANRVHEEVDLAACRERDVPVLRRCSGGGTVVQGPGCLNYSLILPIEEAGPLATIRTTNTFVMERHRQVLAELLGLPVTVEGVTDLALGLLKFSGNAQRRRKGWLLFHGTFLFGFDVSLVMALLRAPPRQPLYRQGRAHAQFMTSLPIAADQLKQAIATSWGASGERRVFPEALVARLVREKYTTQAWNCKL